MVKSFLGLLKSLVLISCCFELVVGLAKLIERNRALLLAIDELRNRWDWLTSTLISFRRVLIFLFSKLRSWIIFDVPRTSHSYTHIIHKYCVRDHFSFVTFLFLDSWCLQGISFFICIPAKLKNVRAKAFLCVIDSFCFVYFSSTLGS